MRIIRSEMAPVGHIGQMNIGIAQSEVERMNRLTRLHWYVDYANTLITRDDPYLDGDARDWYLTNLSTGNCWVVCKEHTTVLLNE